jgi:hypothetical protein
MSYQAIVCRLKNVRKHSNADRLNVAAAQNMQVIVGLDNTEGQLGVMFIDDGCLSERMAAENNLYSNSELNKDNTKRGFFGKNARVRAQKFRGEKSYGFWTELTSVAWTGVNLNELEEGYTFTHLNGEEVCKKYINPATLRRAQTNRQKTADSFKKELNRRFAHLKQHTDTKQLRYEIGRIPEGSILYLTEKCHGTSGRTGHVYAEISLSSTKRWWNKYFGWVKSFEPRKEYQYATGTRRVILDPNQTQDQGYYAGKNFRIEVHNRLKKLGIPKGVELFYELVGFSEDGGSLMPSHSIEKIGDKKLQKAMRKRYGDVMTYSYGCEADCPVPEKRYDIFVYRATTTNQDGEIYELSWPQTKDLCNMLGIKHVPDLRFPIIYRDDILFGRAEKDKKEALLNIVENFLDVDSTIDFRHITEGVCVRVETPTGDTYILKDKSFGFKILEGIIKSDGETIDTEEAEDLAAEGE